MSRNEAQTRFELIDPALEKRGWMRTDVRAEVTAAQIDIVDGKWSGASSGMKPERNARRRAADGSRPLLRSSASASS
jgi:type I site-specific restriction endonuclease